MEDDTYLKPYKKFLVDVTASKAALDKALEFANDLFNALEAAGHRVVIAPAGEALSRAEIDEREVPRKERNVYYHRGIWSPHRPTIVYVGTVPIGLAIVEMSEDVPVRYVGGKYVRETDYVPPRASRHFGDRSWTITKDLPSGRFRLVAYCPHQRVNWQIEWKETAKSSLRNTVRQIVKSLEGAAVELVGMMEEADRQAEMERQKWLAEQEKWRRDEDRRRVEQSVRESSEHVGEVIQQWSKVTSVERFLSGVAERAEELSGPEREAVLKRLALAREFLGSQDPLDFFLSWKTPGERYRSAYPAEEEHPPA